MRIRGGAKNPTASRLTPPACELRSQRVGSSAAEQAAVNRQVVGSNPTRPSFWAVGIEA